MFTVRGLSVIVIILAIACFVLGWQVYSLGKSASSLVASLHQQITERDTELSQLRTSARGEFAQLSQPRIWHVRVGPSLVLGETVLAITPKANGIALEMGAAFRPSVFGNFEGVRVLTTAPHWGADDKVVPAPRGVIRVQYEFPLEVTEATISVAP